MYNVVKVGVSIPVDLYAKLNDLSKRMGIKSRSRIIQIALREYILNKSIELKQDVDVIGVIGVYYIHGKRHVDEELVEIQHEYLDIIISTQHIHLTKESCAEFIIVRGKISRIEELIRDLSKTEIIHIDHMLIPFS
ncbi:MAG: CopG family ribbon-helix-helix protein [Sulfolobales archaeon]